VSKALRHLFTQPEVEPIVRYASSQCGLHRNYLPKLGGLMVRRFSYRDRFMPIKKRTLPKRPPKKFVPLLPPAVRRHHKACDSLYNRLQQKTLGGVMSASKEIAGLINCSFDENLAFSYEYLASCIMERVDCTVTTLQINFPDQVTYRCVMSYTDRKKEPKYGYQYPRMTVVSCSTSLSHSVTIAYAALSKQTGFFI